jgi:hypothetical protein
MASDLNQSSVPQPTSIFNSSGNYVVPAGVTRIFVSTIGASGGPRGLRSSAGGGNSADEGVVGGDAISGGSVVGVIPGSTYAVTIGAAGVRGAQGTAYNFRYGTNYNFGADGTAGGSTGFDGVTIANGANGSSGYTNGTNGTMTFNSTTLPPVFPAGAVARVTGNSTGATQGQRSGQITIFPM